MRLYLKKLTMKTLEEYIVQYKSNLEYLEEHTDETFEEILRTVEHDKFYCTPSRFEESLWILEVMTEREPSSILPIVKRSNVFTDYHVEKKYVNCLRIKVDPFTDLKKEDLDGYISN